MSVARPSADLFDKLPPQNLDAEKGVIGSLLLMNESIDEIGDNLRSTHFYSDANQRIFGAIHRLYESGIRGIDAVTLAEELDRKDELERVGGAVYLGEILDAVPNAAHVKYYADIVRDKFVQRSLIYACTEILRASFDASQDTDELLQSAEQKIFQILEQKEETGKFDMGSILIDAWDRINQRLAIEGSISGLQTGFADLDERTNGFQKAELIILAARPSMGKTALICNWAEGVTEHTDQGVLIFSLEQSRVDLAERFLCIRARVDGHKLRAGDLQEDERHHLMEVTQKLSEVPIYIDDAPGRTMSQIAAISRRMKRQHGLGLVVIDYLQLIEPEDRRTPREQQIAQITRRLKGIAKELDIPIVALAQLNRGVELREEKRPRLADLRESGAIEQDADLVMFLHRPDQYDPADQPGIAELIIAKHRSGPTGIVKLTWRKEYMRFESHSGAAEPPGGYMPDNGGQF